MGIITIRMVGGLAKIYDTYQVRHRASQFADVASYADLAQDGNQVASYRQALCACASSRSLLAFVARRCGSYC